MSLDWTWINSLQALPLICQSGFLDTREILSSIANYQDWIGMWHDVKEELTAENEAKGRVILDGSERSLWAQRLSLDAHIATIAFARQVFETVIGINRTSGGVDSSF